MNIKKAKFTDEEGKEILAALKQKHPPHVYKRLTALKLKAVDGLPSDEVGTYTGFHKSSVNLIVRRYHEQGIEAIVEKRHNHGNRYMTFEQEVEFLAQYMESSRAGQVIEVAEIYLAYQEAVGHSVTRGAIYYLLKKHGWRKIMPRGKHPKKASDEAIEAYKKNKRGDHLVKNITPQSVGAQKVIDRLFPATTLESTAMSTVPFHHWMEKCLF